MRRVTLILTLLALGQPASVRPAFALDEGSAQEECEGEDCDDGEALEGITVHSRRPLTAASQRTVRDRDFLLNPRQTASDLMTVVPQLHISQHSGGGKGHQIFLRGFDAEHGDDLGVYFEGIPLNLPSHAHGIGYTDLHFLIPETIERMDVLKGPYEPRFGDFSTAGAVDFRLKERVDENSVEFKGGSFHNYQGTLLLSLPVDEFDSLIAVQGFTTDGFTDASDWQGFRGLASAGFDIGERGRLRMVYVGYGSEWNAPDTIPAAAVAAGDIGFYGAVDESDGGEAERHQGSLHLDLPLGPGLALEARAYFARNRTKIFSNYTYYASDPDRGDQDEQSDARWTYGLAAELLYAHDFGEVLLESTFGLGFRGDAVDMGIWRTTKRERWDAAARFDYLIHDLSAFARFEVVPASWVRVIAGARLDALFFDVDGVQDFQRPSGALDEDQPIGGTAERFVPQPKASVVFTPLRGFDLFLNFGTGFHSPDARDPVRNANSDVPLAYVGELGVRLARWEMVDLALVGWGAYLEKETFFDPLLGRSVDQGESRRIGFDLEMRVHFFDWLEAQLDLGYTDARLIASGDEVPGSPDWMGALALHAQHPIGLKGGVRLRYVGRRALDKGQEGEDAWLLDVLVEYRWRFVAVGVSVENALARRWKDAQFYYASRYDPEDTSDPTPSKHFTAGTPIAARGWVRVYF